MFSTEESLRRRTGPLGTGRLKYLQALVTEYQDTSEKGMFSNRDHRCIFILVYHLRIFSVLFCVCIVTLCSSCIPIGSPAFINLVFLTKLVKSKILNMHGCLSL